MTENTDHVRDILQRLSTGSKVDSNNLKEAVEKISDGAGIKTEDYTEIDTVGKIVDKISDQVVEFQNRILGDTIEAWGFNKSDVENALIELQRYRKLGTVEKCREAVENQKPKKPILEGNGYTVGEIGYDTWYCPNCGQWYNADYDNHKQYCTECGQKIDWSKKRMSDNKLKPCPFCGGKASLIETYCKDTDFRGYFVHHACRIFLDTLRTSSYDNEEDAIKAWNKRCEDGE